MKLSANFFTGNLLLLLGRESEFQSSNLFGLALNQNIKGFVLDIFSRRGLAFHRRSTIESLLRIGYPTYGGEAYIGRSAWQKRS